MYKYHRISCNSKGFNCALYIQNSVLLLLYYMLITACTYFVYILLQLCTETSFQKKKKKKKNHHHHQQQQQQKACLVQILIITYLTIISLTLAKKHPQVQNHSVTLPKTSVSTSKYLPLFDLHFG